MQMQLMLFLSNCKWLCIYITDDLLVKPWSWFWLLKCLPSYIWSIRFLLWGLWFRCGEKKSPWPKSTPLKSSMKQTFLEVANAKIISNGVSIAFFWRLQDFTVANATVDSSAAIELRLWENYHLAPRAARCRLGVGRVSDDPEKSGEN